MHVYLDPEQNSITIEDKSFNFPRRYEVMLLALIIKYKAVSAKSAVDFSSFTQIISKVGQGTTLNRKQMLRLIDSLDEGLRLIDSLDEGLAYFSSFAVCTKILHHPRKRTVGPWWWVAPNKIEFRISNEKILEAKLPARHNNKNETSRLLTSTTPSIDAQFKLAKNSAIDESRKILWQIFFADAHAWDGAFCDVANAFDDDPAWRLASDAAHIHRHLRLARAYDVLRQFDDNEAEIKAATERITSNKVLKTFFDVSIQQQKIRALYNSNPVVAHSNVFAAANMEIDNAFNLATFITDANSDHVHRASGEVSGPATVNPNMLGRLYSLRSLAMRRAIEALPADTDALTINEYVNACVADSIAAIVCLLATHDLETTQCMIANTAYCLQKIAERGWLNANKLASADIEVFEWYRLSFAWHNRFHLAENNVWEYIFVGEFWLSCERRKSAGYANSATHEVDMYEGADINTDLRVADDMINNHTECHGSHPSQLEFYIKALKCAEHVEDPRQIAHAAAIMYRFSTLNHHRTQINRAKKTLQRIERSHPDVMELLKSEPWGAELPDAARK